MHKRKTIQLLGFAGLAPFVVPAMLTLTNPTYSGFAIPVAETYAFGIICFLTGSWWGMGFDKENTPAIVLSNVFFILAFVGLMLLPAWWSLAASILLAGIFVLERSQSLFPDLPLYYRTMRAVLTLTSSCSMLIIHFAR